MPPTMPEYRVSDGADVSIPFDIWEFTINGVDVDLEKYTKDTAIGRLDFAKFRADGDFFFITTKLFGEITMKVMESKPESEMPPGFYVADMPPPPEKYKCEIWATKHQTSEIQGKLKLKRKRQ